MTRTRLTVVGDALLDLDFEGEVDRLCAEAPVPVLDETDRRARPGGAGLAAALSAADGQETTLVTALAGDGAGRELARLLAGAGIHVVDLGHEGTTPVKVRLRCNGNLLVRLDRNGKGIQRVGPASEEALHAVSEADAVLVSDYGRGMAGEPRLREALTETAAKRPVIWDPHPQGTDPVRGTHLATPNRREAQQLVPEAENDVGRARALLSRWETNAVCVTLGAKGAAVVGWRRTALVVPAREIEARDPCGAGDRFASAVAALLGQGALLAEAVANAVGIASDFVGAGGAGSIRLGSRKTNGELVDETAESVVRGVRAIGGTVVMTGGCFDLLHAGHIHTLRAARALGDCLVVALNSDVSVRRLKGPDRPLIPQEDRIAVLRALDCVDAVVVFDEDTPDGVLECFRPDVWAKGGDYSLDDDLPERRVLARWDGEAIVLPYIDGHSTTRLLEELHLRARS